MTLTEYFGKKSNLLNAHYGIYLEHLLTELSTFPPDFSMKLPKAEDNTLKYHFNIYAVDISKYKDFFMNPYVRVDISKHKDFFMNPYVRSELQARLSHNRGAYVDLVRGRIIPVRNETERRTALDKISDAFLI
jgi:hypothetical protein